LLQQANKPISSCMQQFIIECALQFQHSCLFMCTILLCVCVYLGGGPRLVWCHPVATVAVAAGGLISNDVAAEACTRSVSGSTRTRRDCALKVSSGNTAVPTNAVAAHPWYHCFAVLAMSLVSSLRSANEPAHPISQCRPFSCFPLLLCNALLLLQPLPSSVILLLSCAHRIFLARIKQQQRKRGGSIDQHTSSGHGLVTGHINQQQMQQEPGGASSRSNSCSGAPSTVRAFKPPPSFKVGVCDLQPCRD
jgi:hypothetical protein